MITSPHCCFQLDQRRCSGVFAAATRIQTGDMCVCVCARVTLTRLLLLIWAFFFSFLTLLPLEGIGDGAHATSKHQSRLRCRWTLCPFITHALKHLAVIRCASGEGLGGHSASCSPGPLVTNRQTFIPHYHWLCANSCAPVLFCRRSNFLVLFCHLASHLLPLCLSPAPRFAHLRRTCTGEVSAGGPACGCHDNGAHQNPMKWIFLSLHQTDK